MENNAIREMVRARAVMAAMSGITDIPFRVMVRKFGCEFAFTEMLDVNAVVYKNRKSFKIMDTVPGDSPLGVQIVGEDVERMVYVARSCEEKGFKILDINAGCPVRKVVRQGKGSALLRTPRKLAKMVQRLVKELTIPVTVKMRSGWDEENLNYLEVAKAVASEGASAICIHSRTREQMYRGKVNHDIAREVKQAVDIPVFATGNLFKVQDVADVIGSTGCDGVFMARGALGRPWIFRQIKAYFAGEDHESIPSFGEIKDIMREHYTLCLDRHDEAFAIKRMYKHVTWYLKRFKNLNEIMMAYGRLRGREAFMEFVDQLYLDGRHLGLGKRKALI